MQSQSLSLPGVLGKASSDPCPDCCSVYFVASVGAEFFKYSNDEGYKNLPFASTAIIIDSRENLSMMINVLYRPNETVVLSATGYMKIGTVGKEDRVQFNGGLSYGFNATLGSEEVGYPSDLAMGVFLELLGRKSKLGRFSIFVEGKYLIVNSLENNTPYASSINIRYWIDIRDRK